jgi:hypothetical protein
LEKPKVEVLTFSLQETSLGAEYAKKKYDIKLDEKLLRLLADKILTEMREHDQSFENVRRGILNGADIHPWSNNGPAYYGALGKMFSLRRVVQQKHQPRGLKRKVSRFRAPKTVEEGTGQLAWRF